MPYVIYNKHVAQEVFGDAKGVVTKHMNKEVHLCGTSTVQVL